MKKIASLFVAIALIAVFTTPALAAPGPGHGFFPPWIFWQHGPGNAGLGNAFGLGGGSITLASGTGRIGRVGPFFGAGPTTATQTTVTQSGGSSQSVVSCTNRPSSWARPFPGSNWVSLQSDCNTSLAATDFTYSTTFNLPTNQNGISISGRVLADDSVTIQLNGNTIMNNGGSLGSPTTFSSNNSAFFTTGTNTLTFIVHNVTGPSGLDYVAQMNGGRGNAGRHGQQRGDTDNDGD